MRQKLHSITQTLRLPSICILCNQFHKSTLAVCSSCIEFIKPLGPACQHCATPLPDKDYPVCGQCIQKPPHFDRALVNYRFEEPLRSLLHHFKYNNGLYLSSFLSQIMLHSAQNQSISAQCLIPVPMHSKRLKQRGFNQAALLAKRLARKLNLPYDATTCQKIINTTPQASLNSEQRKKNLHHAFHAGPLPYEHVILIDDLLTTGCTANELARTIKKTGVQKVDLWCCARTVKN
ncbi:ComF family protein [Legionella antarctica]|uniref:ComF family protein n=1 Tax=Legionella antarctica TaxID=2708020 RepID=UPI001D02F1C6|nr:ComF family protein [Legionella antarctica]